MTNFCLNQKFLLRLRDTDNAYTNAGTDTTETLYGYADCTPNNNITENWLPDDPFTFGNTGSGGDSIMIEWAVDENGNSIYESISNLTFRYIRITTAVSIIHPDFGESSTEIDAVGICP